MNNRATINTSSAYHIMHAALLLIIACAGTYHPHAEPLQTSTIPANPLNWLLKDYYVNSSVLNTNILNHGISNFFYYGCLVFAICLLFSCCFGNKCNALVAKSSMIWNIVILVLLVLCVFLCSITSTNMVKDSTTCKNELTSLFNTWDNPSSTSGFIGIANMGNYANDLEAFSFFSLLEGLQSSIYYLDYRLSMLNDALSDISLMYTMTVVNPLNISTNISLPILQSIGPITLSTTYSYYMQNTVKPIATTECAKLSEMAANISQDSIANSMSFYYNVPTLAKELYTFSRDMEPILLQIYQLNFIETYGTATKLNIGAVALAIVLGLVAWFLGKKIKFISLIVVILLTIAGSLYLVIIIEYIANAINISQTCSILNGATTSQQMDMNYVMAWIYDSSPYVSSTTNSFVSSCLFKTDALSYIYNQNIVASMNTMYNQLLSVYNSFTAWYAYVNGDQAYINLANMETQIRGTFNNIEYDPSSQDSPYATNMLAALNAFTNTNTPCQIQDLWIFDSDNCPDNITYIGPDDPNFSTYPIGPPSCLSVIEINSTMFNIRYNSSFTSQCDPNNQIYKAYNPLNLFSFSAYTVISNAINSFSEYLYIAQPMERISAGLNAQVASMMANIQKYMQGISGLATNSNSPDICANIKSSMRQYAVDKCQWAAHSSWALIYSFLILISVMAYICLIVITMKSKPQASLYLDTKQNIIYGRIDKS